MAADKLLDLASGQSFVQGNAVGDSAVELAGSRVLVVDMDGAGNVLLGEVVDIEYFPVWKFRSGLPSDPSVRGKR